MSYLAFQALVRRDLRLFFMDRRAVTMSFIAPIVIGSFFGYIFGGVSSNSQPSKISVAAVDRRRPRRRQSPRRPFSRARGCACRGPER